MKKGGEGYAPADPAVEFDADFAALQPAQLVSRHRSLNCLHLSISIMLILTGTAGVDPSLSSGMRLTPRRTLAETPKRREPRATSTPSGRPSLSAQLPAQS